MNKQTLYTNTVHPGHGTRVVINASGHTIIADEPTELGGTNTGANPLELLLGAYGSCQSIVAQIYAEQFGIKFDELRVELEGDIDLDGYSNKSDVRPGFSEIRYKFIFKTDESDEKLRPFIDFVVSKCPVGDSIANPVTLVNTEVKIEKPLAASA